MNHKVVPGWVFVLLTAANVGAGEESQSRLVRRAEAPQQIITEPAPGPLVSSDAPPAGASDCSATSRGSLGCTSSGSDAGTCLCADNGCAENGCAENGGAGSCVGDVGCAGGQCDQDGSCATQCTAATGCTSARCSGGCNGLCQAADAVGTCGGCCGTGLDIDGRRDVLAPRRCRSLHVDHRSEYWRECPKRPAVEFRPPVCPAGEPYSQPKLLL